MSIAVIFPVIAPPFAGKSAGKPFVKVDNREVFLRTIELYTTRDNIQQRIVVVPPDDMITMQQRYSAHLGFQGVTVAGGGADWFSCVGRALEKLAAEVTTVIIHDACCPAVPFTLLDALEEALAGAPKGMGGMVPVLPARSAFAGAAGKNLDEYIDMREINEVQSPQIFVREALEAAYGGRDKSGTFMDDAELVIASGGKVGMVPGTRFNQRVDSDEALRIVVDLIGRMPKPKAKTPLTPFDEAQW
jgi:2-C-methyl-D-erythritol 4-phosphate cytidylyltransferase